MKVSSGTSGTSCSRALGIAAAALPDATVSGGEDPVGVDQSAAAVVATVKLQADLPGPEEGAGLSHVHHRQHTVGGQREAGEARSLITAGALPLATVL